MKIFARLVERVRLRIRLLALLLHGVATLLWVVVLCMAIATAACRPKLPPVSGCTPLAHRCEADSPEVCSPSQRWHRVGDLACAEVRAVCVVTDAGVAVCAPRADAGAAAQVEIELPVTSSSTDGGAE